MKWAVDEGRSSIPRGAVIRVVILAVQGSKRRKGSCRPDEKETHPRNQQQTDTSGDGLVQPPRLVEALLSAGSSDRP